MPIGFLFYAPADDPTKTLVIEASCIVRIGQYDDGSTNLVLSNGESLDSTTPLQTLTDDYAALIVASHDAARD